MTKRIAILGATGHIAKGLIERLGPKHIVTRYSRTVHRPLNKLFHDDHDVVINCIGVREKLWTEPFRIFEITERYDNMVLAYLDKHPGTLAINFSSGAVFGTGYDDPIRLDGKAVIDLNNMAGSSPSFYGVAKLNSEAKHRCLAHRNIVDIRVFSYFSRHMRPDDLSIMNEILACIRDGRELGTSPQDFFRDFVHPDDLAQLVECCMDIHDVNTAIDAYSLCPVRKFELLDYFREIYDLRYRINEQFNETSPTGPKPNYYSVNLAAAEMGYYPKYGSLSAIADEAGAMLGQPEGCRI